MNMKKILSLPLAGLLCLAGILPGVQASAQESQNTTEQTQIPYDWIAPAAMQETISQLAEQEASRTLAAPLLQQEVLRILSQEDLEGEWSLSICLADGTPMASVDQDLSLTAASSIKLFVAGAVMSDYDALSERYGKDIIDRLVRSMLAVSDNSSATELVSALGGGNTDEGKAAVNAWCEENGFEQTYLGILFTGIDYTGTYNATSAGDTAQFLCGLLENRYPGSEQILSYMEESDRLNKLPAGLPEDTRTANKTGELDNTENDSCIVYGDRQTYVISVLADDTLHEQALAVMKELSQAAWDLLGAEN